MVGKRSGNSGKIRVSILIRQKLGLTAREIYIEICKAYGRNEVSYTTAVRRIRKFRRGQESVNDSRRSRRKRSAITKQNIQKVKDITAQEARYTVQDITPSVGI